jgi:hypothetical protein
LLPLPLVALVGSGCVENLPERIALAPGAEGVEIVSDPPNPEVYEPVGGVSARVAATEVGEAVRYATYELRNQAAKKGASFVSIDEVTSRASWDLRGRTVVSMVGTAFRQK